MLPLINGLLSVILPAPKTNKTCVTEHTAHLQQLPHDHKQKQSFCFPQNNVLFKLSLGFRQKQRQMALQPYKDSSVRPL